MNAKNLLDEIIADSRRSSIVELVNRNSQMSRKNSEKLVTSGNNFVVPPRKRTQYAKNSKSVSLDELGFQDLCLEDRSSSNKLPKQDSNGSEEMTQEMLKLTINC